MEASPTLSPHIGNRDSSINFALNQTTVNAITLQVKQEVAVTDLDTHSVIIFIILFSLVAVFMVARFKESY